MGDGASPGCWPATCVQMDNARESAIAQRRGKLRVSKEVIVEEVEMPAR